MSSSWGLGGGIGARVARHTVDATVYARQQMLNHNRSLVARTLEDFFQLTGAELRTNFGKLFAQFANADTTPPEIRQAFRFLATGRGQLATMVGSSLAGSFMGAGIGDVFSNALRPTVGLLLRAEPNSVLAAPDAAHIQAMLLDTDYDMAYEARSSGFDSERFRLLTELNRSWPPLAETLDAFNRKLISEGHARIWMTRAGIHPDAHEFLLQLRHLELTPDRLAQLVTFGVLTQDQATPVAERSGMTAHDFDLLVQGNGAPPAPEMLAAAYRRGVIDVHRFRRGLIQGPLRNEWVDLVEQMTRVPMSVADAIEAVVKGHLDDAQGERIAAENGLMPEHWPILRDTAGSPPGIQQMLSWWNRGIITEAQVTQGLRESRLNNKWIPFVKAASETLPEMSTVRSMFAHGVIDQNAALDLLRKHGFAPSVAEALLNATRAEAGARTRDLTVAEVVRLYTDRRLSRVDAHTMLVTLGYDKTEAELRLDLGDIAREERFINAVIGRLHSAYIKYLIDSTEVQSTLDTLGIAAGATADLLNLWDQEQQITSRTLTPAQTIAALKAELIDRDEAVQRLLGAGYADRDAQIIIDLAFRRGGARRG